MASSILNDVIGPVMPGSSSSHTAGPYHIAKTFSDFANKASETVHVSGKKYLLQEPEYNNVDGS